MLHPPSLPSPQHALPPPGLVSVFLFFLIVFLYLGGEISGFHVDFSNTSSSCPAYSCETAGVAVVSPSEFVTDIFYFVSFN
jgi:hypothetical protein